MLFNCIEQEALVIMNYQHILIVINEFAQVLLNQYPKRKTCTENNQHNICQQIQVSLNNWIIFYFIRFRRLKNIETNVTENLAINNENPSEVQIGELYIKVLKK